MTWIDKSKYNKSVEVFIEKCAIPRASLVSMKT